MTRRRCTGCGSRDPYERVAARGGKVFEIELPKIVEPSIDEIPRLSEEARTVALEAVRKKGAAFDAPASVVFVQGMRRCVDGPLLLRAAIIPKALAVRILARQPILAANVVARHPEVLELEEGCTCSAAAVFVGQCGRVAYERLELAG